MCDFYFSHSHQNKTTPRSLWNNASLSDSISSLWRSIFRSYMFEILVFMFRCVSIYDVHFFIKCNKTPILATALGLNPSGRLYAYKPTPCFQNCILEFEIRLIYEHIWYVFSVYYGISTVCGCGLDFYFQDYINIVWMHIEAPYN